MNKLLAFFALAPFAFVPSVAQSASSAAAIGVGPHGYDFMLGKWSCTTSTPSSIGGPSSMTLTATRAHAPSVINARITGRNFDETWYVSYVAKTKSWASPTAFADGSYEFESTTSTGPRAIWAGWYYGAGSPKPAAIRDTFTMSSTKWLDVGELQSGGAWKRLYSVTCNKS